MRHPMGFHAGPPVFECEVGIAVHGGEQAAGGLPQQEAYAPGFLSPKARYDNEAQKRLLHRLEDARTERLPMETRDSDLI